MAANYCFIGRENGNYLFATLHYKPAAKKVVWNYNPNNNKPSKTKLPQVSRRLIDAMAKYGVEWQTSPQKAFVVKKSNERGLDMLTFLIRLGFDWEGHF